MTGMDCCSPGLKGNPIAVRASACRSMQLRGRAKGGSPAMPIDPCGVHVRLHADIVTQADGMPSETPASLPAAPLIPLLEGEKNEWS